MGNFSIPAFAMPAFGCRLGCGERCIMIQKRLRPDLSKTITVSIFVLTHVMGYCHVVSSI
ncbi:hypothetical protein CCGE531_28875 (plasmid) [Rhizobium sp. CCGE531]|nr:hypothetical protein CCGE531_28875 [Rhizobium sp. CCGE531]AYG76441.1 hypothetical protein CCGE532_28350 [Rhizobium sp. CCGE532]